MVWKLAWFIQHSWRERQNVLFRYWHVCAHQIKSRVEMSEGLGSPVQTNKQTNKQTQNIAKYSQLQVFKKICYREDDRGFLVPKWPLTFRCSPQSIPKILECIKQSPSAIFGRCSTGICATLSQTHFKHWSPLDINDRFTKL